MSQEVKEAHNPKHKHRGEAGEAGEGGTLGISLVDRKIRTVSGGTRVGGVGSRSGFGFSPCLHKVKMG